MNLETEITRAIVTYPEKIDDLQDYNPKYFIEPFYKLIHSHIFKMLKDGEKIDTAMIISKLKTSDDIRRFCELDGAIHWRNSDIKRHWQDLKNAHYKERLWAQFNHVARKSKTEAEIDDILNLTKSYIENTEKGIFQCDEISSTTDTAASTVEFVENMIMARRKNQFIYFGIESLDNLVGGLFGEDLIIIGARPSVGKTAIALYFCSSNAFTKPIGFISLEMPKHMLMIRLAASMCGISTAKTKSGRLKPEEQAKLFEAVRTMSDKMKLFIYDTPSDMKQISLIARKMVRRNKIRALIIDYFTLIKTEGNDLVTEYRQVMAQLIELRKEIKIPIIVLSQITRIGEQKPTLATLRQTGSVEEAGDIIILLHPNGKDNITAILAKNRNGPTGDVELTFDKKTQTFLDVPF